MSILVGKDTKLIVQGITGSEGTKHTRRMVASGTNVVGGVNSRKAGADVDGIPVYATVAEAIKETGADASVAFVPPAFTRDAAVEAIDAQIPLLVIITEGVPVQDTAYFFASEGVGVLVDPRRDVQEYVDHAVESKASIAFVLQTHRQEDFNATCPRQLDVPLFPGACLGPGKDERAHE